MDSLPEAVYHLLWATLDDPRVRAAVHDALARWNLKNTLRNQSPDTWKRPSVPEERKNEA